MSKLREEIEFRLLMADVPQEHDLIELTIYMVAIGMTFYWYDWKLFIIFMLWGTGYLHQANGNKYE